MKTLFRPILMWILLAAPVGAVDLTGVQQYPEMCDASAIADAGVLLEGEPFYQMTSLCALTVNSDATNWWITNLVLNNMLLLEP